MTALPEELMREAREIAAKIDSAFSICEPEDVEECIAKPIAAALRARDERAARIAQDGQNAVVTRKQIATAILTYDEATK